MRLTLFIHLKLVIVSVTEQEIPAEISFKNRNNFFACLVVFFSCPVNFAQSGKVVASWKVLVKPTPVDAI